MYLQSKSSFCCKLISLLIMDLKKKPESNRSTTNIHAKKKIGETFMIFTWQNELI